MTANLLTLNISKTEFLLIGLKQQPAKFHNCPIETTHSAHNLSIIFNEHLTFSDQISSLSKSCYSHIRTLRCIRLYLDFRTASTIATFIVHSKLDYCTHYSPIHQILRQIDFNISQMLSLANLPGSHTSLLFSSLSTGWRSRNVLSISFSLSLIKFLLLLSLDIYFNWSLFSLLTVLDPRLLSPYPDHLLHHLSKLQTVLFNMQHPTFGINSIILSVSLIHIMVFHLLTTLLTSDPHCHHHQFHHQSLLLFFTLDLKHTSSSSFFLHRLLYKYSLDWSHGLLAKPFSLAYWFCLVLVLG